MALSQERKGEIALKLLKYRAEKEGVRINKDCSRDLGNVTKATGIPIEELKEFLREVIQEMVDEHLS